MRYTTNSNLKVGGIIVSTVVLFFFSEYDCLGQKKHEILLDKMSQKLPNWEIGISGGVSKFVGTVNLYSSDLFSLYRSDGNDFSLSFGTTIDRRFSKYFSYGVYLSYSQLQGVVTYRGKPNQTLEYLLQMPYGTQGAYKTQVVSAVPTFSVELIEVYNRLLSFKSMTLSRLSLSIGAGMSKTIITDPAFEGSEQFSEYFSEYYYDFDENEDVEYSIMLALRYQRILNERYSVFCGVHYLLVNGARPDGYFLGNEPEFEGIPSPSEDGQPLTADTFLNLQFGIVFRFNKS